MEEDALSIEDILAAALIYRARLQQNSIVFELGSAEDDLISRDTALRCIRVALERGDRVRLEPPR